MTQLSEMRELLAAGCEAEGHKMLKRVGGRDYRIERCIICGAVQARAFTRCGRLFVWAGRAMVEREPWTSEFAYPGPSEPAFKMRLVQVLGDAVTVRLRPLTWRVQPDGRVSEFGALGDSMFRIIWRDLEQRIEMLTGGWPTYERSPVARARLHPRDAVMVDGEAIEGDMVIVGID